MRRARCATVLLVAVLANGCGDGSVESGMKVAGERSLDRGAAPHIAVLVPGWTLESWIGDFGGERGMRILMERMEQDAFFNGSGGLYDALHLVSYSYNAPVQEIGPELGSALLTLLGGYPPGTTYDMITHSLSTFAALYGVLTTTGTLPDGSSLAERMRMYVVLAGIVHGQDPDDTEFGSRLMQRRCQRPKYAGSASCQVVPANNPLITGLLTDHAEVIDRLTKCSIYSTDDRMVVAPRDSGCFHEFANQTCHSVDGLSHMGLVKSQEGFAQLKERCY